MPVAVSIQVDRSRITEKNLPSLTVNVTHTYKFNRIAVQVGTVEFTTGVFNRVLEGVVSPGMTLSTSRSDWRPQAGTLVARDAEQVLSTAVKNRVQFKNWGLPQGPELAVLMNFFEQAAKGTFDTADKALTRGEREVIFTPGLGRLEAQPHNGTFEDYKLKTTNAYAKAYHNRMISERTFTKTYGEFEKWYKAKKTQIGSGGSSGFNAGFPVYGVPVTVGASDSYTFSKNFEQLDVGEKAIYESLFNQCKEYSDTDDTISKTAASEWEGRNCIEGNAPKTISVKKLKNLNDVVSTVITAARVNFQGTILVPFTAATTTLSADASGTIYPAFNPFVGLAGVLRNNVVSAGAPPLFAVGGDGGLQINLRGAPASSTSPAKGPDDTDIRQLIALKLPITQLNLTYVDLATDAAIADLIRSCDNHLHTIELSHSGGPRTIRAAFSQSRNSLSFGSMSISGSFGIEGTVPVKQLFLSGAETDDQIAELINAAGWLESFTLTGCSAGDQSIRALSRQPKLAKLTFGNNANAQGTNLDKLNSSSLTTLVIGQQGPPEPVRPPGFLALRTHMTGCTGDLKIVTQ